MIRAALSRMLDWTVQPLAWWVRLLQTQRTAVPRIEMIVRAILMTPAFAIAIVLLRVRLICLGPMSVDATTFHGQRFRCHPPDLIQMYLWLFRVWEPDLTHFINRRLGRDDLFVDVGSNIGYYSTLAARQIHDQWDKSTKQSSGGLVSVVAIEASPSVFESLLHTIAMNDLGGSVRAIHKAASNTRGRLTVFSGPQHNIGLTTTVKRSGMATETTIDAEPLDDMLTTDELHRVRLIKIDVEGAEPQVLAGMKRVIDEGGQKSTGLEIIIELSPLWWSDATLRPIEVLQPFLTAGFNVYELRNNYWPWRYLWPCVVKPPQRFRGDLTKRVKRLDFVLSRVDADSL